MPTNDRSTRVLVTRPASQAFNLSEQLSAAGLTPIPYPSIEIQTIDADPRARQQLSQLAEQDYLIFTSANAVSHADQLLKRHWPKLPNQLVAIGPKTADNLRRIGLTPSIIAQAPFTSESLLDKFPVQLDAKTATLIKGEGGRSFLADQLRQRGLALQSIDVYRRGRPEYTALPDETLDYITISSQLALSNLFALLPTRAEQLKQHCHFIVFSQRIAEYAQSLGCQHVDASPEASDEGLVSTILRIEKAHEF